MSSSFSDDVVAESAYPERGIGFGPLLAPVPNKVVHEVQYHLDLRIVERFWGSDEKWERIKGERIARFFPRLPSRVWKGQTSFFTISLSRSDKI